MSQETSRNTDEKTHGIDKAEMYETDDKETNEKPEHKTEHNVIEQSDLATNKESDKDIQQVGIDKGVLAKTEEEEEEEEGKDISLPTAELEQGDIAEKLAEENGADLAKQKIQEGDLAKSTDKSNETRLPNAGLERSDEATKADKENETQPPRENTQNDAVSLQEGSEVHNKHEELANGRLANIPPTNKDGVPPVGSKLEGNTLEEKSRESSEEEKNIPYAVVEVYTNYGTTTAEENAVTSTAWEYITETEGKLPDYARFTLVNNVAKHSECPCSLFM